MFEVPRNETNKDQNYLKKHDICHPNNGFYVPLFLPIKV